MKQMRAIMQFLKARSWKGEADASKERAENLKKLKEEKKEKINNFHVFKEDGEKSNR